MENSLTNLPLPDRTIFDIIISLILIVTFLYLIAFVNNHMSKLATYHQIKTDNNPDGELILVKFGLVLLSYLNLILPFFISLFISLKLIFLSLPMLNGEAETIDESIIIYSLVGTLVLFFLMRFLMNPTEKDVYFLLRLRIVEINEKVKNEAKKFKERILSLFLSYVFITLFVFTIFLLANLYGSQNGEGFYQRMLSFSINTDPQLIPIYTIAFFIALVILAAGTEILLIVDKPIIDEPLTRRRQNKAVSLETFETFGLSKKDLILYYLNKKVSPICEMPSKAISLLKLKFGYNK